MVLKCDGFIYELPVGHVGEWDLSSGDLIEHKVNDGPVDYMAHSGDKIVIKRDGIRVFNVLTCLLLLR